MLLEYDVKGLCEVIELFHLSTGVNISIMDGDYSVLGASSSSVEYCGLIQSTKTGRRRCINTNRVLIEACKKKKCTELRLCHAGLIDMAVPIVAEGEVVGYLLLGHIRPEAKLILQNSVSAEGELKDAYDNLPIFESAKINAIVALAELLAKYMVNEKLIGLKKDPTLEAVRNYILANLKNSPNVEDICHGVHIGRTALYSLIKDRTGETVKDYVKRLRLERAKLLLSESDMTVEQIAIEVGLSGAAYLGRLFRSELGISPLKYKKEGNRG